MFFYSPMIMLRVTVNICMSIDVFVEPSIDKVFDRLLLSNFEPKVSQNSDVLSDIFAPIRIAAFIMAIVTGSRICLCKILKLQVPLKCWHFDSRQVARQLSTGQQ